MSEQLAIETPRPLPTLWDGRRVEWEPFTVPPAIFICGPRRGRGTLDQRERCPNCGGHSTRSQAVGLVHPLPSDVEPGEYLRTHRNGTRIYAQEPARPLRELTAFRCPDCFADYVWDRRTNEWWELDDSDYGPEGSVRPDA